MSTAPTTWRDVAMTEYEYELLRHLSHRLGHATFWSASNLEEREALAQVLARWESNDATEFAA